MNQHRIFLFTPLNFETQDHPTRWARCNGVLAKALAARGCDVKYVSYGVASGDRQNGISMAATHEELSSTAWWKEQAPDLALLGGGLSPDMLPVHQSARRAGVRTMLDYDASGVISPHFTSSRAFWYETRSQYSDARRHWPKARAWARFGYYVLRHHHAHHRILDFLSSVDLVRIVSPLALGRMTRFCQEQGRPDLVAKFVLIPHPVEIPGEADMPGVPERKKQVVATGRWDSYAKNSRLLTKTLEAFLRIAPDYTAVIAGSGQEALDPDLHKLPEAIAARISVTGFIGHEALLQLYSGSRMYLMTSRSESFNIAAAQALCMGCSVVAPPQIPTASWFCGAQSGTVANSYRSAALVEALMIEDQAWAANQRAPAEIAAHFRNMVSTASCADILVNRLPCRTG
jgi:hypothetical protein